MELRPGAMALTSTPVAMSLLITSYAIYVYSKLCACMRCSSAVLVAEVYVRRSIP